jgi:hypothetical protein
MNTALSGSGRVDDIKGHPQGELRGATKLVKTEMRRVLAREPYEKKIQKVEQLLRLVREFPRQRKCRQLHAQNLPALLCPAVVRRRRTRQAVVSTEAEA